MSGVMNPGQRQGLMDQVMKGLAIAESVYGIKAKIAEADRRDQQDLDAKEGNISAADYATKIAPDFDKVDANTPGATKIGVRRGDNVEEVFMMRKKPKISPEYREVGGNVVMIDPTNNTSKVVYQGEKKPEKVTYSSFEYTDKNGDKRLGRMDSNGQRLMASDDPLKEPATAGSDSFKKLPKQDQIAVEELGKGIASKTAIAEQIDNQLANIRQSIAEGKEDLAVQQGAEMLKILNSDMGKDAVGAEEAKRLGAFLEYKIANFTGPGSFFGRDIDQFFEQAAQKNNSIKASIADSQKRLDNILAGRGNAPLKPTDTKLAPKGGDGTAMASGKPKTVIQNGHTYHLNEKTGEYE